MGTLDEKMQPDKKILCLVCQKGKVSKIISGRTIRPANPSAKIWNRGDGISKPY